MFFKRRTERVGFEPTDAFTSAVFKTAALNHSATFPIPVIIGHLIKIVKDHLKDVHYANDLYLEDHTLHPKIVLKVL